MKAKKLLLFGLMMAICNIALVQGNISAQDVPETTDEYLEYKVQAGHTNIAAIAKGWYGDFARIRVKYHRDGQIYNVLGILKRANESINIYRLKPGDAMKLPRINGLIGLVKKDLNRNELNGLCKFRHMLAEQYLRDGRGIEATTICKETLLYFQGSKYDCGKCSTLAKNTMDAPKPTKVETVVKRDMKRKVERVSGEDDKKWKMVAEHARLRYEIAKQRELAEEKKRRAEKNRKWRRITEGAKFRYETARQKELTEARKKRLAEKRRRRVEEAARRREAARKREVEAARMKAGKVQQGEATLQDINKRQAEIDHKIDMLNGEILKLRGGTEKLAGKAASDRKKTREALLEKIDSLNDEVAKLRELLALKTDAQRLRRSDLPKYYTVKPGDTLRGIAIRIYGTSKATRCILSANRQIVRPHHITAGGKIRLPDDCAAATQDGYR